MTAPAPVWPLAHPGPRDERRTESVPSPSAVVQTMLTPGTRLVDALAAAVERAGYANAQVEIMGGTLNRVSYCIPDRCRDGSAAMAYSETKETLVPAQLLTASVTLGYRDGERFMHCHAAWLDAGGHLHGGHLWPETRIGDVPAYAVIHALPGVALINGIDPETRMPAFTPRATKSSQDVVGPTTSRRAVVSRVKPGEDVVHAAIQICQAHGFGTAVVRASLGSLVGACLRARDAMVHVDGPATEVISLTGRLRDGGSSGYDGELSVILVDRHAVVHAGQLVPGRNLVAVTFELLVEEECEASTDG